MKGLGIARFCLISYRLAILVPKVETDGERPHQSRSNPTSKEAKIGCRNYENYIIVSDVSI